MSSSAQQCAAIALTASFGVLIALGYFLADLPLFA